MRAPFQFQYPARAEPLPPQEVQSFFAPVAPAILGGGHYQYQARAEPLLPPVDEIFVDSWMPIMPAVVFGPDEMVGYH